MVAVVLLYLVVVVVGDAPPVFLRKRTECCFEGTVSEERTR